MTFDTKVAKDVGTDAAIILSNIEYWQTKNKVNNINFFEGRYWTYNSVVAWSELFDYLSRSQIKRCLKKLEDKNYLSVGNFNKSAYDRTKWYSSNRIEKQTVPLDETNSSIRRNEPMEESKEANRKDQSSQPIPNINTDISKTNINTDNNLLMSKIKISDLEGKTVEYFEIAKAFQQLFIKNLQESNAPTKHQEEAKFKNYVDPIRLMMEKDGVTIEQLKKVYKFLGSPEGHFWRPNILSTKKLREKFTQLILKAQQNGKQQVTNSQNGGATDEYRRKVAEKLGIV